MGDDKCGKYLFLMLLVVALAFLLYNRQSEQSTPGTESFDDINLTAEHEAKYGTNYEAKHENASRVSGESIATIESSDKRSSLIAEQDSQYILPNDYAPPEADWLNGKFDSRNRAHGKYKSSSYSAGRRGALSASDWNDYFDKNNRVIGNSLEGDDDNNNNDQFLPQDESNNGFAPFKSGDRATCGSNQDCDPEDLFDPIKYLPAQVNDDWFEVQPEPISVKNRHLINITKPIGVDTIGSSNRNQSYDVRGTPQNPKFVVSPFLNSSIEPDNHLKPMY